MSRECLVTGRHLVKHGANRKQIGMSIQLLTPYLLRRHICHRSDRTAGSGCFVVAPAERPGRLCEWIGGCFRRQQFCQPEVQYLRLTARAHKNIGRLDVAMDDPLGVRGFQGIHYLDGQIDGLLLRQWPASNVILQSPTFEQLHHDELLLIMLTDLIHRADIRMIERRSSTRFAQEPLERALIFCQILGQELQGHRSLQDKVFGTVNDPHAAASELFENAVVGHSRAKHRARSGSYRANLRPAVLASQRMWLDWIVFFWLAVQSDAVRAQLLVVTTWLLLLLANMASAQVLPKPQITSAQGKLAPDFTLKDQEGRPFRLASLRGKRVLLVFYRGYW